MNFSHVRLGFFGLALAGATPAVADMQAKLVSADIAQGEKLFKRCVACHTIEKDGRNKVGPNLYGVVGKAVAQVEGYSYSPALKTYGGEWTLERLDAYLHQPRAEVKGTKMAFPGLKKEDERANLIAYLNTFSDKPVQFGAAEEKVEPASQAASADPATDTAQPIEGDFGRLKVAPGVEATYYACSSCHSEMIVAQQGLTRENWVDMLDWMVKEQEMDEIAEPERTEILDYLSTHYNKDRPNFQKPN